MKAKTISLEIEQAEVMVKIFAAAQILLGIGLFWAIEAHIV
jgi:hypothetical protein